MKNIQSILDKAAVCIYDLRDSLYRNAYTISFTTRIKYDTLPLRPQIVVLMETKRWHFSVWLIFMC